MNVLTITTWDSSGEQFNGYLVHQELLRQGHQSDMAVMHKEKDDSTIHILGSRLARFFDRTVIKVVEELLGIRCLLPISGWSLLLKKYYRDSEIIHLQMIHGNPFFSLLLIPLIGRHHRIVWTLHDPWMLTGHCVHPLDCTRWRSGCGDCPDLARTFRIARDGTGLMWRLKARVIASSNPTIVVASRWMQEMVRKSPVFSHLPCHLIPFGIEGTFADKMTRPSARQSLGIPADATVIAFRYRGDAEPFKGVSYIEEALLKIRFDKPVYLLTIDQKGGLERLRDRYKVIELGWVEDRRTVIEALTAADLFLMPSVAEAFGMMAIESMACGTPVIVFEGTALPDVIHAPQGGIAVPRDAGALAGAIEMVLGDRELYESLVENGRRIVREEYSVEQYTQRHIDLYRQLTCEKEGAKQT